MSYPFRSLQICNGANTSGQNFHPQQKFPSIGQFFPIIINKINPQNYWLKILGISNSYHRTINNIYILTNFDKQNFQEG